ILAVLAVLAVFQIASPGNGGPSTLLVTVPDVVDMNEESALNTLESFKLVGVIKNESSDTVPEGLVIRTNPVARSQVEENAVIEVFISTGPIEFTVPNLVGLTQEEAIDRLAADG